MNEFDGVVVSGAVKPGGDRSRAGQAARSEIRNLEATIANSTGAQRRNARNRLRTQRARLDAARRTATSRGSRTFTSDGTTGGRGATRGLLATAGSEAEAARRLRRLGMN